MAGDLDNVVEHALAPSPRDRYSSIEQLAADIGRYLAGRPVVAAHPPPLSHRARKFVRRNLLAVALGSAAAVGLAAAGAVLILESHHVRLERDAARRQQRRAEEVTRFLVEAFDLADPHHARGRSVTAREVLERGASRITGSLGGDPALQSALMDAIGRVYTNLGLYDDARPLLEGALSRRRAQGEDSPEVAETMTHLGLLWHVLGDESAAEGAFRRALEIRRGALGEDHALTAESMAYLGYALRERGDLEAAEPLIRQALLLQRRLLGDDHMEVAVTRAELAFLLRGKGAFAEAEALCREAIASHRRNGRQDSPEAATALSILAWIVDDRGDAAAAAVLYRETLAVRRRVFGEQHPEVASTLNSLAGVLRAAGDYAGAEEAAHDGLEMNRRLLPAGHPELGASLTNLAAVLRDEGKAAAAEPLFREALAIVRRAHPDDPDVGTILTNLGTVQLDLGRYGPAESALREALALRRRRLGPRHPDVGNTLTQLAVLKRATRHPREALALATEAVEIQSAALPEGHWRTAVARSVLGDCLVSLGRLDEAQPLLRGSADLLAAKLGAHSSAARRAAERVARYEDARLAQQANTPWTKPGRGFRPGQ
jgi:serine/threonine-protein kinase